MLAPQTSNISGRLMDEKMEKVSYLIGRQVAGSLLQQGIKVELKKFCEGIEDGVNNKELPFTNEEAAQIMQSFEAEMQEKLQAEKNAFSEKNLQAGLEFLDKNKNEDGIQITDSGIQYRVLEDASGDKPKATDTVETHYEGKLLSGEVFDSSIQRGESVSFPVGGVIKGWQEVLQLMSVGARWQVFIPAHLAYGENGSPPKIGPNSVLEFEIQLINIV